MKENAKKYTTLHGAKTALGIAVKKYDWRDIKLTAVIEKIEIS